MYEYWYVVCIYLHIMCVLSVCRDQNKMADPSGTGVIDGCESQCRFWEPNTGLYESFQSYGQEFLDLVKYTQVFLEKWNKIFRIAVRNKQKV